MATMTSALGLTSRTAGKKQSLLGWTEEGMKRRRELLGMYEDEEEAVDPWRPGNTRYQPVDRGAPVYDPVKPRKRSAANARTLLNRY